MMRTCIYCGKEKAETEFTLEHIFPDRLGGALCTELFKTRDVCKRCNIITGLFVDGTFIKSWFRTNDEAMASQEYLDPRSPTSISPLSYMGILNGLPLPDDEVCEIWLGPCGVHYYHIHRRDDPRWDSFAGGDPIARKSDPGRVYVLFTTAQVDWVSLSLRSVRAYFPKARRYGANVELRSEPGATEFLISMDDVAKKEAAKIIALPEPKNMTVLTNIAFEQRFMAKMALGLGYKILGADFLATEYAKRLRGALWEQDLSKRAEFGLRGSGFLNDKSNTTSEFMGWKGAYTILFYAIGEQLVLSLHFPSSRAVHLVMSDEPSLWQEQGFAPYREGVVFLVLPQLGHFAGPVHLPEYVSHRLGNHRVTVLRDIEARRIDPASLPACR
jgi:hypothetical protein